MANTNNTNQHLNAEHMKTNRMKMFAKDNPWRPIYIACVLFLAIGYLFYFAAYLLPTPQWGRDLMTWAMPMLKGLDSAARVGAIKGTDPFPAQVVILYCAFGSILLTGWSLFWVCYSSEVREALLLHYVNLDKDKKPSRGGMFLAGIVGISCSPFVYGIYWLSVTHLTWREVRFYSSNIGSISFLLIAAVIFSSCAGVSSLITYMSFLKQPLLFKGKI